MKKKTYKNNRLGWTAESYGTEYMQLKRGDTFMGLYPAELIEDSPDWKLKPIWEITAFSNESKSVIYKLFGDGNYYCECHNNKYSYDTLMNDFKIPIFSVLREDGVTLTEGDKTNQGVIEKFWINGEEMRVDMEKNIFSFIISDLTPCNVILTTEDGFSIDDPEQILYYVSLSGAINKQAAKIFRVTQTGKYFLSRELAEKYISENKPRFSEKQIRDAFKSSIYSYEQLINRLNELK